MIAFEAKLPDSINILGGWLDTTMQEIFDSYTSQIRYDELYMQSVLLTPIDTTGILALPPDLQHLDLENIRYQPQANSDTQYQLFARRGVWGTNDGSPRFVIRNSATTNLSQISIWPIAEISTSDRLVINYWRHAISEGVDETIELAPAQLVTTVKLAMIARATLFGSSKQFQIFKQESDMAHGQSLGATELHSTNG